MMESFFKELTLAGDSHGRLLYASPISASYPPLPGYQLDTSRPMLRFRDVIYVPWILSHDPCLKAVKQDSDTSHDKNIQTGVTDSTEDNIQYNANKKIEHNFITHAAVSTCSSTAVSGFSCVKQEPVENLPIVSKPNESNQVTWTKCQQTASSTLNLHGEIKRENVKQATGKPRERKDKSVDKHMSLKKARPPAADLDINSQELKFEDKNVQHAREGVSNPAGYSARNELIKESVVIKPIVIEPILITPIVQNPSLNHSSFDQIDPDKVRKNCQKRSSDSANNKKSKEKRRKIVKSALCLTKNHPNQNDSSKINVTSNTNDQKRNSGSTKNIKRIDREKNAKRADTAKNIKDTDSEGNLHKKKVTKSTQCNKSTTSNQLNNSSTFSIISSKNSHPRYAYSVKNIKGTNNIKPNLKSTPCLHAHNPLDQNNPRAIEKIPRKNDQNRNADSSKNKKVPDKKKSNSKAYSIPSLNKTGCSSVSSSAKVLEQLKNKHSKKISKDNPCLSKNESKNKEPKKAIAKKKPKLITENSSNELLEAFYNALGNSCPKATPVSNSWRTLPFHSVNSNSTKKMENFEKCCPFGCSFTEPLLEHSLEKHLPFWVSPQTACWSCQKGFASAKAMDRHFGWCPKGGSFGQQNLAVWAGMARAFLNHLVHYMGLSDTKELLCFARDTMKNMLPFYTLDVQQDILIYVYDFCQGDFLTPQKWKDFEGKLDFFTTGCLVQWRLLLHLLAVIDKSRDWMHHTPSVPYPVLDFVPSVADTLCHLSEIVTDSKGNTFDFSSFKVANVKSSMIDWNSPPVQLERTLIFEIIGVNPYQVIQGRDHIEYLWGKVVDDIDKLTVKAIGETGLNWDPSYPAILLEDQIELLLKHAAIAEEQKKPLVLLLKGWSEEFPNKSVYQKALEILSGRHLSIMLHNFNGTLQDMECWLAQYPQTKFGFSSHVFQKDAGQDLSLVAKALEIGQILLESDFPNLQSEWGLSTSYGPANIMEVAQWLGEIKHLPVELIMEVAARNAEQFFDV